MPSLSSNLLGEWQPGQRGKGLAHQDGRVVIEPYREGEHHWDIRDKYLPGSYLSHLHPFEVDEDGRVSSAHWEGPVPQFIIDAHPALHHAESNGWKFADQGWGGDAYPAEEPQAELDRQHVNESFGQDPGNNLGGDHPVIDYKFIFANGELDVSGQHDHQELAERNNVPPDHTGPMAVGTVTVQDGVAIWEVSSNIGGQSLAKLLQKYTRDAGWKWGGMTDMQGDPVGNDEKLARTRWYFAHDETQLLLSREPWKIAEGGRVDVVGRVAAVRFKPDTQQPAMYREALQQWADDFGYKLAEVPGGGSMTDPTMMKNHPPLGTDLETHNIPGRTDYPKDRDRMPHGIFKCPDCGRLFHRWQEYMLHREGELSKTPVGEPDGKFPEVEEVANQEMRLEPGIHTGSGHDVRTPTPNAAVIGRENGEVWYSPEGQPHDWFWYEYDPELFEKEHPPRMGDTDEYGNIIWHGEGDWSFDGKSARMDRMAEKAPKDMFKEPVPFIYDIEKDAIFVGHPGGKHSDIDVGFSPGGIVEGEYQPGGKVLLKTKTTMPYSIRHMVGLWYYQHPEFEVTGVELDTGDGNTRKVAADETIGAYVVSLAAQDPAVHQAWQALREAGGKVYVVGGAVRDALLNKTPKDIDLMVTGLPSTVVDHTLRKLPGRVDLTGKDFGVYRYNTAGHEVEVALPRTERSTGDRRVDFDVSVDHTLPVEDDLLRRDFTANAIAIDLDSGRIVDPYGGAQDIAARSLRTVHPNSFREDPTRLVRGLVAMSRHGLEPDEETLAQMREHAPALAKESPERIQAELEKLMKSDDPAKAIRLAHETGMLHYILPEVDDAFGFDQRNPHHNYDLGTHLLQVLDNTAKQTDDPDVRMAALLHDIGKPASQWINPETGFGHYYHNAELGVGQNHEEVGADMAASRLEALKWFPKERVKRIEHLIRHHMYPDFSSKGGARKFLNRVGDEHAEDLFVLRAADRAGKGTDDYQALKTPVAKQQEVVEAVRSAGEATDKSNLAIGGNDLIGLGLKPGPAFTQILNSLTDLVLEHPEMNDRHVLLQYVRQELMPSAI
jgi:tRNA nucleotidyltransferase (CCA-adding enzyme)